MSEQNAVPKLDLPEKLQKYTDLVRELYSGRIEDMMDRGFSKCQICGLPVAPIQQYINHETNLIGHAMCVRNYPEWKGWIMSKQNPAPDWDKIKKLAQGMSGLVDEIEKEIGDGNDNN